MKRVIPILFILGGCLLLTLGVATFGAVFFFSRTDTSDPSVWKPPLAQVDNTAFAPATLILPLTGIEGADALSATLDKAHLENAFAIIAYDPTLTDPVRIGALLQLGTRYSAAKNTAKAVAVYQAATLLATLSPSISDPARLDTYMQAINDLRALNATAAARSTLDQAYLVAQFSPAFRVEARVRRLQQIADDYAALGANNLADQARSKANDASSSPSETATVATRVPFVISVGKLPVAPDLEAAKTARIAAAKQLSDDLKNTNPKSIKEWPSDSVGQLGDSLLQEDSSRQAYYDKQIPQAKDPALQMALLRDKVNWLSLKYRVARGGFGADLVPEWKQDASAIGDALSAAWEDYVRAAQARAAGVAKPQDPSQATEDVVRQELVASRWGWLAGVPEQEIVTALGDVTQNLMGKSVPALRLDSVTRNGKTLFILVPDDLYGQGDKALPK